MHQRSDPLTLRCPAKLNLTLAVGSPQADGLHPIASIMAALDFGDDLLLQRLDQGPSTFQRRFADDAPKPQPIDWPIEDDLIYRAHQAMEAQAGQALPVMCQLDKRIPAGAGLGGGSSNAAAMLVGLNQLFEIGLDEDQLLGMAVSLGADVVFLAQAMLGRRAALVTGIGERIEPIRLPAFDIVLVFPDGTCPTGPVYSAFDQALAGIEKAISQGLIQSWLDAGLPEPYNDLKEAAIQVCPAIQPTIDAIHSQELVAQLTGSGSALYAIVESQQDALANAQAMQEKGFPATATRYQTLP